MQRSSALRLHKHAPKKGVFLIPVHIFWTHQHWLMLSGSSSPFIYITNEWKWHAHFHKKCEVSSSSFVSYWHAGSFLVLSPLCVITGQLPDCVHLYHVNTLTSSLVERSHHASPNLSFLVSTFTPFLHLYMSLLAALWSTVTFLWFPTILLSICTCYPGFLELH